MTDKNMASERAGLREKQPVHIKVPMYEFLSDKDRGKIDAMMEAIKAHRDSGSSDDVMEIISKAVR